MKYILTVMILLAAGFAKGQIVNIPDSNFKKYLLNDYLPTIDVNGDGEIQESEALIVSSLTLPPYRITDVTGIRSFENLEDFILMDNYITSLDVSGLSHLQYILADNNRIASVNFTGCASLRNLVLSSNNLSTLVLDGLNNLRWLDCSNNPMLTVLDGHGSPKLEKVVSWMGNNNLQLVNLTDCDSLIDLNLSESRIQTVDISRSNKIKQLTALGFIENLIVKNCRSLETINSGQTAPWKVNNFLDVTGCTNLKTIFLQESNLLSLDVSTCINLQNLSLPHNGYLFPTTNPVNGLKYLNIKNGSSLSILDIGAWGMPNQNTLNICADDFEIGATNAVFQNAVNNFGAVVNVSSYCSFLPGGTYNTISGKTRLDLNNNGCDTSDAAMPNVALRLSDGLGNSSTRYSTSSGDYAYYPYKGIFTLTAYFPYPYFNVNPLFSAVTFDTVNSLLATRDFCIQPNGVHNDLEITFLPTFPPARPGFNAEYTVTYKNRGTTTLSGNVQVNFDNSKMNFVSASENISTQSTGQLSWNYNNLQPFESRTIYVTFNILPPPVNNIGDTITYLASITPSVNDETAFDNSFILPQRVIGSFDPNDKQCLEGSKLDISKIGDYLHYQIHFQNEGTDTAFSIVVADTLSDKLDWNSFELISSSHPVNAKLTNNKAEFIFQNINLPYKAINEPASNGWVAFKIKPKPSVVIGDSLNNKAAIYFDFNKPVITNTATTIVSSVSTPVPVKLEYFSVNSSVHTNILNWKAACSYGSAKFTIERSGDGIHFSSIGNITATSTRCQLPFHFTDNNPVTGKNYYRLKITDADDISFYSKILITGNNKAGITITSVSGNTVYLNSNKQQSIQLKLIAADGKEILNERKTIVAGNNSINLQMKNAAEGIYTLTVYLGEGSIITTRFIK